MSFRDANARRTERERRRRAQARRRRTAAGSLLLVIAVIAGVAIASTGGGNGSTHETQAGRAGARRAANGGVQTVSGRSATTSIPRGTGTPANATVPILMYHVINQPPAGAP